MEAFIDQGLADPQVSGAETGKQTRSHGMHSESQRKKDIARKNHNTSKQVHSDNSL